MRIIENYDLTKLNTFGMSVHARFFTEINDESDLDELFSFTLFKKEKHFFLGGGSNILFTRDFDGLVILNKLKGIHILEENLESVLIKCMSGEVWHNVVLFAVERGYWGIENLSLIPGTVGGAPVQNIGAYGVELKGVLENVEGFEIETGHKRVFRNEECDFGYRDSVFKNSLKGRYFISAVTLKLSKIPKPNISYKILEKYLEENNIKVKKSKDISDAVASIRRSKLPDPAVIGNAGSFFKNVFVTEDKLQNFLKSYPDVPYFKEGEVIKIPAAWLIERCGPKEEVSWKGYRVGNVGVHTKQALVLVNYGGGRGEEIKDLSDKIIESVFSKFGLKLEREVNLI